MSYIWRGVDGWGHCLNVVDIFRQWLAFVFSSRATLHEAIMAVNNTVGAANPKSGLTLRVYNGTRYTSREFRSSAAAPEIIPKYIYVNTPEQNGRAESIHKPLKSTSCRGSLPTSMKPEWRWMRRLGTPSQYALKYLAHSGLQSGTGRTRRAPYPI